jgi:hypothetical protein
VYDFCPWEALSSIKAKRDVSQMIVGKGGALGVVCQLVTEERPHDRVREARGEDLLLGVAVYRFPAAFHDGAKDVHLVRFANQAAKDPFAFGEPVWQVEVAMVMHGFANHRPILRADVFPLWDKVIDKAGVEQQMTANMRVVPCVGVPKRLRHDDLPEAPEVMKLADQPRKVGVVATEAEVVCDKLAVACDDPRVLDLCPAHVVHALLSDLVKDREVLFATVLDFPSVKNRFHVMLLMLTIGG